MITGNLKKEINLLWQEFWQGGVANPLSVIEQITFLMFARILDINETRDEKRLQRTGQGFTRRFQDREQHLRWSRFRHLGGEEMLAVVRDEVFKHMRERTGKNTTLELFMRDAQLIIQKPSLLVNAVTMIDRLPLTEGDTKGDLYEFLLGKLSNAGINGQFRTPRHLIQFIIQMMQPKPTDVICDPSCGTGGFLVETMDFLKRHYSSEAGTFDIKDETSGEISKIYTGDLLEDHLDHIKSEMFYGFDFDTSMLRISAMNMILHGVEKPNIHYQDTLSGSFSEKFPDISENRFDLILANPPFKGTLDFDDVHPGLLQNVKTRKTELLFLALILRLLKPGGRSATIVPDGVLFGSSSAHVNVRRKLLEENQLDAVISLPSGVFKPYAGVSTGILIFTKGGTTNKTFFYNVEDDGLSKDDKRSPIEKNDLPNCLELWSQRETRSLTNRTEQGFFVSKEEIRARDFDLSFNRYAEKVYSQINYKAPELILEEIEVLNQEISSGIKKLREILS